MNQTAIFVGNKWYWLSLSGWKRMMEIQRHDEAIIDLYERGFSPMKIAKELGFKYSDVKYILRINQ
jgi:hypothetical protein